MISEKWHLSVPLGELHDAQLQIISPIKQMHKELKNHGYKQLIILYIYYTLFFFFFFGNPYSNQLLMSALCRELYIQFQAHESYNRTPLMIIEITNEIEIRLQKNNPFVTQLEIHCLQYSLPILVCYRCKPWIFRRRPSVFALALLTIQSCKRNME